MSKLGHKSDCSLHPNPRAALAQLIEHGLTFADCVETFSERQTEEGLAFIAQAREQWHKDGAIEIDDNGIACGSEDNGDYVMAWVWVDGPDSDEN